MNPSIPLKICVECGKAFIPKGDGAICEACLIAMIEQFLKGAAPQENGAPLIRFEEGAETQETAAPLIRFEKEKLLYKSDWCEIWRVRERETGNVYALKMLCDKYGIRDRERNIFLTGADIGMALCHENVVSTVETGETNDIPYQLMELCDGADVDDLLQKRGGKLSIALATRIILQVLSALDYIHHADLSWTPQERPFFQQKAKARLSGIVHRDIKPSHMLLTGDPNAPTVKLTGFHIAGHDASGEDYEAWCVSDDSLLKPHAAFQPRQLAIDFRHAKPESDVWAAAAVFYFVLTGKLPKPFQKGEPVFQTVVSRAAVPIRERDESIPAALAAVIDRALADQGELYYKSAEALRQDIITALPEDVRSGLAGIIGPEGGGAPLEPSAGYNIEIKRMNLARARAELAWAQERQSEVEERIRICESKRDQERLHRTPYERIQLSAELRCLMPLREQCKKHVEAAQRYADMLDNETAGSEERERLRKAAAELFARTREMLDGLNEGIQIKIDEALNKAEEDAKNAQRDLARAENDMLNAATPEARQTAERAAANAKDIIARWASMEGDQKRRMEARRLAEAFEVEKNEAADIKRLMDVLAALFKDNRPDN